MLKNQLHDKRNGKCCCEMCRSLSFSDQNIIVMNAIAKAASERYLTQPAFAMPESDINAIKK